MVHFDKFMVAEFDSSADLKYAHVALLNLYEFDTDLVLNSRYTLKCKEGRTWYLGFSFKILKEGVFYRNEWVRFG